MLEVLGALVVGALLIVSAGAIIAFIHVLLTGGEGRGPG